MLHPPVTVPIAFVKGMLSGSRTRGHECRLLEEAGIAPELLLQAAARVTADQYVALFRLLIERLDDDALGFLSRPFKRGSFALVARSAIGAETLDVAMRRMARTFRLVQDDLTLVPVAEDRLAGWAFAAGDATAELPVFRDELLVRVFWRLLSWLIGGQLPAVRFDFAFARPDHAEHYGKVFPAGLRFGQPRSAFWFDAALLASPVRRDEAALRTYLADAQNNMVVPRRGDDAFSAGVRNHLRHTSPTWPDLSATAEALHMSIATVQRHLANEGTSFQALKNELRRDLAIVRLNTTTVPMATLAFELGFADSPAFQRAFKTWTGSPPGAYRRGTGGAPRRIGAAQSSRSLPGDPC